MLSPAEGSALIASTANRMDETCEVTAETADRVASMQALETERVRKGTWPEWARLETGPAEEHAGLHCSICEAHANPNGEGQRVGALITDGRQGAHPRPGGRGRGKRRRGDPVNTCLRVLVGFFLGVLAAFR